jgi:hypothetical protein
MKRAASGLAVITLCWMCAPRSAGAQTPDGLEVAVGASWLGTGTFAEVESTQITPGGPPKSVLRTTTSLDASLGIAARVGLSLTSRLSVEGAVALNPTHLTTAVEGDVENLPEVSVSEPLTQYLFEGGVRWRLGPVRTGGFAPFLSTGGGYLRQLHDQQTLASTGRSFYVGAGGHLPFRRGTGLIESAGLRFDVRLNVLSGGAATDESSHAIPAAGAALFIRF